MSDTVILGLNFGLHDSSASLLVNGRIVAAAEEERFSREKHTTAFPSGAIAYCLVEAGLSMSDVTDVAYYWNTQGRWGERLAHHATQCLQRAATPRRLARYLRGFVASRGGADVQDMLAPGRALRRHVGAEGGFELRTLNHHRCHAASTYYPGGFDDAAILIVDGSAELESTTLYRGQRSGDRAA